MVDLLRTFTQMGDPGNLTAQAIGKLFTQNFLRSITQAELFVKLEGLRRPA